MAEVSNGGDKLVMNPGLDPLVKYNYMLRVEALIDVPVRKVRAFTREMEYEFIQEGGLNDYVHIRRKPISRPHTLVIERYAGTYMLDPLPNGAELLLPLVLMVFRDQWTQPKRTYTFTGCTVIKKTYGELSAEESGLLIDEIEIAYREFVIFDMPMDIYPDRVNYSGKQKKKSSTSIIPPTAAQLEELKKKQVPTVYNGSQKKKSSTSIMPPTAAQLDELKKKQIPTVYSGSQLKKDSTSKLPPAADQIAQLKKKRKPEKSVSKIYKRPKAPSQSHGLKPYTGQVAQQPYIYVSHNPKRQYNKPDYKQKNPVPSQRYNALAASRVHMSGLAGRSLKHYAAKRVPKPAAKPKVYNRF